jgi:MFS family permease
VARGVTHNNKLIYLIIAAMGAGNIAFGLMTQLVPLAMNAEGDTKFLIGGNVMAGQAGVMLAGFYLARLRQHFKSHSLVMGCMALALFVYAGFALTSPLYYWFFYRFLMGIAGAVIYTTGESWLQANSDDRSRGRVMGVYMTSQTISFALGPFFVIPLTGATGWLPWSFCIVPVLLSLLLESSVNVEEVATGQKAARLWPTLTGAKFIFTCVGMVTFFEAFMLTFFSLFAKEHGYTDGSASQLLSFGIAMPMLLFFPIGWLADHWSRRGMLLVCALISFICALLIGWVIDSWAVWLVIVVLRGCAFGVYLVGYALLGERYKGTDMVAAASVNSLLWGVSGVIGPPLAGLAFDRFGLGLLPYFLAACFIPVLLGLGISRKPVAAS